MSIPRLTNKLIALAFKLRFDQRILELLPVCTFHFSILINL